MLLSLAWLREFVPYEGTAEELGAALTRLGLELEDLRRPFQELRGLVVGFVVERLQHPNSDHLSLCRVDLGDETPVDIVCGAPNVARGQYVAVAPVGAVLPGGLKIRKARLRGADSCGMICSERELGLSDEHEGILVLQETGQGPFHPGQPLLEALCLDNEVLDISVTPNRADCLSVLGLARETALAFKLPLRLPALDKSGVEVSDAGLDGLELVVDKELSPFYQLRLISDLSARPGPARMRWRLRACGQRAISNLVDVTNYIMLELGQPLHSFDFAKVRGGRVLVAGAEPGESLLTLDGQTRLLNPQDITIRDAEGPIGLGGVMGGAGTAINAESRAVLLEGAVFNPSRIWRASRRLSLPSEAAGRFAHGVDAELTAFALERAALLIARLGGGKVSSFALSSGVAASPRERIRLRLDRAELLTGVSLQSSFCLETLRSLGCEAEEEAKDAASSARWSVLPPSWRPDLKLEADLIEELARVYGVDKVPERIPRISHAMEKAGHPEDRHAFLTRVKAEAAGIGLNEVINYSFTGHKTLDTLGCAREGRISILNPLSAEQNVLRPMLAPGLLEALRNNLAQGASCLRLFETASAFSADASSPTGTGVRENTRLGLLLYGDRHPQVWPHRPGDADYLDMKGLVEHFIAWLDLPRPEFRLMPDGPAWLASAVETRLGECPVGTLGLIKAELADACHARKEVWLAELNLDALRELTAGRKLKFAPLPLYPPVRRDITIIAPPDMECAVVQRAIEGQRPEHLREVFLLDLYQPESAPERHLTYRLVFRSASRTLLDAEVDKTRDKLARALTEQLAVRV